MIAVLMTTYNRPEALARSAEQVARFKLQTLVVDDGSNQDAAERNRTTCGWHGLGYLKLPENRGLAAALNAGLAYLIADKEIRWISYLQDDVEVHPDLFKEMARASDTIAAALYTGHDSGDHPSYGEQAGFKLKRSCAGIHMHARVEFWASCMPIPTYMLGAPKQIHGRVRGVGSNVDWHIVHEVDRRGERIVCVPGMVRTFLHKAKDSSWGNEPKCGEDPPLMECTK